MRGQNYPFVTAVHVVSAHRLALPFPAVVTAPDQSVEIALVSGTSRPVGEWLTTFPLVVAVVDPYTHESAWLLDTIRRIFDTYRGADCRVAWLVTAGGAEAKQFLGPLTDEFLTLTDESRSLVKSLGLERLPALVALRQDGSVLGAAQGWDPATWRPVLEALSQLTKWSKPNVPAKGDPAAYPGSPALG